MTEVGVLRVRRYYLRMRFRAALLDPWARGSIDAVFRAKQEACPGTPLPSTFPFLAGLAERGYTTIEDLHGADLAELREQGFSYIDAAIILDQLQLLPVPVDPPVLPAPADP